MSTPSLLILAGDGIGPEVMAEVRKIIDWYGEKRDLKFNVSDGKKKEKGNYPFS